MAIKHKRSTELKIAGAQLPIKINGKPTRVWIDSGSPISIFTIGELRRTLGASLLKLDTLSEEENAIRDYENNPLQIIGAMAVRLESIYTYILCINYLRQNVNTYKHTYIHTYIHT